MCTTAGRPWYICMYTRVEDTGAGARWWESWRRRTALFERVRGAEAGVAGSRRVLRTMQVGERDTGTRGETESERERERHGRARAAISRPTTDRPHLLRIIRQPTRRDATSSRGVATPKYARYFPNRRFFPTHRPDGTTLPIPSVFYRAKNSNIALRSSTTGEAPRTGHKFKR